MTSLNRKLDDGESRVRFVVGIDLGTTNCACSYVDLDRLERGEGTAIETFLIPQGVAPNVAEERDVLPSFFARTPNPPVLDWETSEQRRDFSLKGRAGLAPKDGKYGVVGTLARDYGAVETDSFVSSAKSWLCHSGVDRGAPILPWSVGSASEHEGDSPRRRWSPVEISSFYIRHIRAAWNAKRPDFPLETQDVVLTIPASFDETARMLTLEAAKLAGLPRVALVEEPQAAFYSWLAKHEEDWTDFVAPGQKILVCDVGGGTTDFALIYALEREGEDTRGGRVKFYRVAVGDHLVLGGDNLDHALYKYLEAKVLEKRTTPLSSRERALLLKEAREAKEAFLGEDNDGPTTRRVFLPSAGSKLIGGGVSIEIERSEVEKLLVDGFFPLTDASSVPARRRSGLRELALPYAADPAVTKYLAYFLAAHENAGRALERAGAIGGLRSVAGAASESGVDAVLFNGGAFESPKLRARIVENLTNWRGSAPTVLHNESLYLAVARGAAYYGLALRGRGARIGASLARTYYVGVGLADAEGGSARRAKAVCLLPSQCEPGDEIVLEKTFKLAVEQPVSFPIFVSSVRATDAPGDLVDIDPNETRELAPIRTALKTRSRAKKEARTITARLVARPTEIGTIELFLQEVLPEDAPVRARASRWTLQFDARGGVQSDWEAGDSEGESEGVVDESLVEAARNALRALFASDGELGGLERIKPGELYRKISDGFGVPKDEIPFTALRRLAETALELASGRNRGPAVEARWLNWLGFALRPGFGSAADDWRVEQTWKTVAGRLLFNTPETRMQNWILWRRVASGLTAGRQLTLAEPILSSVRDFRRQLVEGQGKRPSLDLASQEGAEIWRMLGALELLPLDVKEEIGDAILDVSVKKRTRPIRDALVWALGRIGARVLFNAPLDRTLAPSVAARWAARLLDACDSGAIEPTGADFFALAQLTRVSGESAFDVDVATRARVGAFLAKMNVEEATLAALERHGKLVSDATKEIFGESLPLGLRWEGRAL